MTTADETESELKRREEKGVCKEVVGQLKKVEAAACFAAFFLNYESGGGISFELLKGMIADMFGKKVICGDSFVEANEEEQKEMLELIVTALADVTDDDARMMTRMRVRKFIQLASR